VRPGVRWAATVRLGEPVRIRALESTGDAPSVSVVIPCFNYARFLPEAVESALSQAGVVVDVIIVDDASTDDSLAVAHRLAASDARVRVLAHPANAGPVRTFNDGLTLVSGEFLVRLDADDMLKPLMLERTVALLEANRSVSIAYTDWQVIGATSSILHAGPWELASMCVVNRIPYCSLYSRGVWAATGGYNPKQSLWEDYDFWLACIERGVQGERVSEPLFLYRARPGTRTDDAEPRRAQLFRELARNHPALFTPRLRFQLLVGRVRRALVRRAGLSG